MVEEEEEDFGEKDITITKFGKNKLKITSESKGFFILDPNRYDINTLMMLIDLKKINKIEDEFKRKGYDVGLSRVDFIKTVKKEFSVNSSDPFDEINMVYGLYKLFCETDLSGDCIMQWSEFTQFMIDRVEGEGDSDPNDTQALKEKEMIKYKRYIVSNKVRDLNIHKKDIITGIYHPKFDQLLITEYDNKILKYYNPKTGKIDKTENLRDSIDYFKDGEYVRLKEKGIKDVMEKDLYKKREFSVLSMTLSPRGVIGMCLSSQEISFHVIIPNKPSKCIHVMETSILQKRIWYLPHHDIWFSSGRIEPNVEPSEGYYCIYELDVDFERNYSNNKIECLHNGKNVWYRQKFIEKKFAKGEEHRDEIMDVIEILKPLLILTACLDGKIRLININDNNFLKIWLNPNDNPSIKQEYKLFGKGQRKGITSLVYSPHVETNGLILSTGFHYHICIFATDLSLDTAYKGKLEGHYAPVVSVIFLANSYMCASLDEDAFVKIFDTKSKQCLQSIAPEKKNLQVSCILHIPKYNRLAIYGNKIIFYDPKYSEEEIKRQKNNLLNVQNYPIQCFFNKYHMAFYIITSKDLRVYSAANGSLVHAFKKFLEQDRFDSDVVIKNCLFDYRHRLIYLGFSNGTVQQFNAGNGSLIKPINEYEVEKEGICTIKTHHTKEVTSMFLFHSKPEEPDAIFILGTTGLDSLVNMYDERDPEVSHKLRGIKNSHKRGDKQSEILHMDFSQAFNKLATAGADGLVCVWDFEKSRMTDICFYPNYNSGAFSIVGLKFLDPFLTLAVAYTTGAIFFYGVEDKYSGECYFRFDNYYVKEGGQLETCQIRSMLFVYEEVDEIPRKLLFSDTFLANMPPNIVRDDDLQENDKYRPPNSKKAYLLLGDSQGYLRCIDMFPIFHKYEFQEQRSYEILSTFNILKKEEINAEPSLIYLLQDEKTLKVPCTSIYPNLMINEEKRHFGEIIHLSLIEEPYSFISSSVDKRVRIWDFQLNLLGEIYTGTGEPDPPLVKWNFNVDWEKLKKEEIQELLDIAKKLDMGNSFFVSKDKLRDPIYNEEYQNKKEQEEEKEKEKENEKKKSELFQTQIPAIKEKRFKKIIHQKIRTIDPSDKVDFNESYEQKVINEDCRAIDELIEGKGYTIGMNEMKNNVIDQVISGKDVMDLFEPHFKRKMTTRKATNSTIKVLPKIYNNRNKLSYDSDTKNELYSEKFIKKQDENLKQNLLLPFLNYEFKKNENTRFRPGETEKILAFEYYNNSYKECCKIKNTNESVASLRENYHKMWNFVNDFANGTKAQSIGPRKIRQRKNKSTLDESYDK